MLKALDKEYVIVNPYSGQVLGEFFFQDGYVANKVLTELHQGRFVQNNLSEFERADILRRFADLLTRDQEQLARLVTSETGKTIRESRLEITRAVATMMCSAEEARRINGEILSSDSYPPMRKKMGLVQWRPIGGVMAITPFNFPVNIPAHKIGPAFAAGNTLFFKPAPQTYFSSSFFIQLGYEAGVPETVLRMCMIDVPELAAAVQSPFIQCVNFTGGMTAGFDLSKKIGLKKIILELSGNDALIVFPDADLDVAAATAIQQRFGVAGQRCTAAKRLFIHHSIYRSFVDKLLDGTSRLVVGDPALEETDVGPVINSGAADEVMARIAEAVREGAGVLTGNRRDGNLIYPTILENVPDKTGLVSDETFGPVIPLRAFDTLEELVQLVNSQRYGLQAGVFTNHLPTIKKLFEAVEVGTLIVNDGPGFRAEHFPFGGVKDSGIGREGIRYAIREMSIRKTLVL